jgi:PAS domain S-box-containing protein
MQTDRSETTHSAKADAGRQALLEIAVSHCSAIFYVANLSPEQPYRYISPNVEAVTGHEAKSFLAEASYAARQVHPEDLAAYEATIRALTDKGGKESSRTLEYRFTISAGDYRWFRDQMSIVETREGKTERVGCMIDITSEKHAALEHRDAEEERRRREDEIRRMQETLEDAIDSLSEGFTLFDAEDRLIMCNSRFKEFNQAHGDLLVPGNKWVDIARAMARRGVFKSALGRVDHWLKKRQARRGRVHNEEFELTDGRWIEYSHRQTRQGGIVTTWRDITERKKMEQALRDNEELIRRVVEDCPLPIVMTRVDDGKILFESPASKQAFGNEPDDARGTVRSRYADPDCRVDYIKMLRKRGAIDNYEILFQRPDGGVFVGAVSARLVEYRGEEAIVSTTIDLTERNKRENELRHAREILEDAIEALSEGLALYDADDRLVICNSQYKNFHGDSADLLVPGADWLQVTRKRGERGFFATAGDDIDAWLEGQLAQRGVAQNEEFLAEGGRWFAYSHRPTRQGGFVSTWHEITEQKKAERELRDREALVRQVLEACPLPVRMWNFDSGLVLYESPACRKIFGRDSTMDGTKSDPSVYVNPDDRKRYREQLETASRVDHMEIELRRLPDATFWASVSAQLIEYKGERVVVSNIVDLTERKRMEQAIREREEQFRHIVEGHPLPVWMVDMQTARIIYESPAAAAIVGREWPSAETGYTTDYFADPAERDPINEWLRETGELRDVECRFKKADGTVFWVSLNDKLIEYDGREVSITGFVDLTERKQREAELQRARETLEDAIESLPDGFSLFDADNSLIMCNSRFKEYNALSADVLVPGTSWQDFIRAGAERGQYQEAIGREAEWIKDRLKHGSLGTGQEGGVEFQQSDGRWYHAFSQSTRQGGYVGIRVDITERKKMEDSLRNSEAMVRQVLEACPVPITMNYAGDGIILYESPAAQFLLGYESPQEGRSVVERWVDPRDRETYLARLHRDGAVDGLEVRYKNAGGEEFPCSLSSRLIDYQGAEVIVSSIFDLTERKASESELERQREMLHQSEKLSALGELLACVSHELNNPLSVLVGQAMMLQETATDPEIKARADKIDNAADRCARIVKSFLAMARQEPTRAEPVDLNAIIEEALEVTGYSLRTADIDLVWRAANGLPAVLADPDQMRQVFTNLIVNAQHALETVEARRQLRIITSYRKARNEVVIKVKDNGTGVPANVKSRIFEPLYTTKEIGTGTGMGLALCHRIVEAHGGTIELESRPGEGAAFAIRLPCADRQEQTRPIPDPGHQHAGGYRVLVVDDEFDVGQIISDVLAHGGHSVEVAQSGRLALEKIKRRRYDVVLSDIRMPNMDGPTLYQAIQDTRPEQIEGLAFITGDTLSPRVKEFLNASQRPYLEKPIAPKDICDLVDLLTRRQAN